jgi:DNA-binding transcriptional MerR regulator
MKKKVKNKVIVGIPTKAICNVTGVKQSTFSTWKMKRLIFPSIRENAGRGGDLWSFGDLVEVKTIVKLKDMGQSIQKIRKVVSWLREHGYSLGSVILRVAGDTVEAFTDEGLAWDVLKRQGQGVFVFWQGIVDSAKSEYETYKVELKQAA